jgi:hypothetical protein
MMGYKDISDPATAPTFEGPVDFKGGVSYDSTPGAFVPNGGVIAYSGLLAGIIAPWYFCDGTNGTPDMRGITVYGCTDDDDMGDTGGSATHSHGGGSLAAANASAGTPAGTIAWPAGVPTAAMSGKTAESTESTLDVCQDNPVTSYAIMNHDHGKGTLAATLSWPAGVPTFSGSALAGHGHSLSGDTADASNLGPYIKLGWIMLILPT